MHIYNKPCIYKITNHITNKVYIGSTVEVYKRHYQHVRELSAGTHHSIKLQRSWDIHGSTAFSFQIVEYIDNPDIILEREQFYVDLFNSIKQGYNCRYPELRRSNQGIEEYNQKRREYREKNREITNKKYKLKYKSNIEEHHQRWAKYFKDNKEDIQKRCRQRYAENKDEINRKRREKRAAKKNSPKC